MSKSILITAVAITLGFTGAVSAQQGSVNGIDLNPIKKYSGEQPIAPGVPPQSGEPTNVTNDDWWRDGDKKQPSERSANNVPGEKPDNPQDWWKRGERSTQ